MGVIVIVATLFPGDGDIDLYLHWLQHDVYGRALRIISDRCYTHAERASEILDYREWGRVRIRDGPRLTFDHRTLQKAHDILAAVWRFRHSFELRQFDFPVEQINSMDPNFISPWWKWSDWWEWHLEWGQPQFMEHWLKWLRGEIESWIHHPERVHLVMKILANQNQPIGYQAETELAWELLTGYDDVPWHKRQLDAVKYDMAHRSSE